MTGRRENLGKLGSTPFAATEIALALSQPWFLPASAVNGLRRDAVTALEAARAAAYRRPPRAAPVEPPVAYPENELSYLGNVLNSQARAFYEMPVAGKMKKGRQISILPVAP